MVPKTSGYLTSCVLCRGIGLVPILNLGDQPLAERFDGHAKNYPLGLNECLRCGMVQLSYAVDPAEVFPPNHPYSTGNSRALRWHYDRLAAHIVGQYAGSGGVYVDIGANDGTLLNYVAGRNPLVHCVGVEPTDQAAKITEPNTSAYREFFTPDTARKIRQTHGKARVITACNVLAHVAEPHQFAAAVRTLLRQDGLFITENHDVSSVVRDGQWDTVYHEHRWYWSVATLSTLLAGAGLEVVAAEPVSTHGGSMRITARHKARTETLQGKADTSSLLLYEMLRSLKAEGSEIFGIGATTRAVPLVRFCGIEDFLTCICEVPGSEKIGSDLPGTSVPVVSEDQLFREQPPYALILSWHMADGIIKSLRDKGYQGKCIIPLPRPEIIP